MSTSPYSPALACFFRPPRTGMASGSGPHTALHPTRKSYLAPKSLGHNDHLFAFRFYCVDVIVVRRGWCAGGHGGDSLSFSRSLSLNLRGPRNTPPCWKQSKKPSWLTSWVTTVCGLSNTTVCTSTHT